MKPLVSVIVPTYNSSEFLERCLQSISSQTYENIEIIVVDNNSTDSTKDIASKFTEKVFNKGPERSAQRNFGVDKSAGTYVLIIDSDMELDETVVRQCIDIFSKKPSVMGVIIPEESFGSGFWAQCKKLERSYYVGIHWIEAARAFRKSAYKEAGGYNESMVSGEDWDLSQRIAELGKLDRIEAYICHNEGRLSLVSTLRKKYYYAQQLSVYMKNNKNNAAYTKQVSVVHRFGMFLSQPLKLFRNPFVGIGLLFMKLSEYFVGGLGYLWSKR